MNLLYGRRVQLYRSVITSPRSNHSDRMLHDEKAHLIWKGQSMTKARKSLATLTVVVVTTTTSLFTVSSALAHYLPLEPAHNLADAMRGDSSGISVPVPGAVGSAPGTVETTPVPGTVGPVPGVVLPDSDAADAEPRPRNPRNRGIGRGEAAALGVLGGIIIGGAIANANRRSANFGDFPAEHYLYCERRYRSYVAATNSFTGYDGQQHTCNSPYVQ